MSLLLDVNHALSQYLPQDTHSCDFIESIPSSNTSIILPNWTCNDLNYTIFDFSRFTNVESIEIGDDSFYSVQTFRIDGLNKLQTLKIGVRSFSISKAAHDNMFYYDGPVKSFHILNCGSLLSIEIGPDSFAEFGGEFELYNLPLLQSIRFDYRFGNEQYVSFYDSPFILRGILKDVLLLLDLPSLQSIELRATAFSNTKTIIMESKDNKNR